jgi:hypothetical protein
MARARWIDVVDQDDQGLGDSLGQLPATKLRKSSPQRRCNRSVKPSAHRYYRFWLQPERTCTLSALLTGFEALARDN